MKSVKNLLMFAILLLSASVTSAMPSHLYQVDGISYPPGSTAVAEWPGIVTVGLCISAPVYQADILGILLQGNAHFIGNPVPGPIVQNMIIDPPFPWPDGGEFLPINLPPDPSAYPLPAGKLLDFTVSLVEVPPAYLWLVDAQGMIGEPLRLVPEPAMIGLLALGGMMLRAKKAKLKA